MFDFFIFTLLFDLNCCPISCSFFTKKRNQLFEPSRGVEVRPNVIVDAAGAAWPFSVSVLMKSVAFLDTLHWLAHAGNLGGGGVSYVELLILYELWAGERLVLEKSFPQIPS